MITIQQMGATHLSMRCHYAYRSRCHSIPGASFDYARKFWIAPISSLPYILKEFNGELYFKTPLWKLEGSRPDTEKKTLYLGPEPDVPHLELRPYPYQERGIKYMIDRLNNVGFVLNGDAVGLGKTIESIGTMKWFVENRGARKILIICKKSIKTQWESEIRRIAGWDKVPIFITGSTKKKRLDAYKGIQESPIGILITNYHNFLNDSEEINKTNYDICIIDEAHCIKSREGKMNRLIGDTVCGKRTILLTGTPIMSRPDDIWGIVRMVAPHYFGTYDQFKARYIVTEFGIYGEQIIGARHLDELQERIQHFLIMRTAEDVALDLPKRLPAKRVPCHMDATQIKMQAIVEERKARQDQKKKEILDTYGVNEKTMEEIEKLNELGKMYIATLQFIADDPAVFRYMRPERGMNKQLQEMLPDAYTSSEKTDATVDIVSEIVDADEKVIVFCHFASTARMLKAQFDRIPGANTVMYTGAESDEKREQNIASFKTDPDCRVIIGTEAMAEGLNLQVARYVIHYEQADTYAQREQRIGRVRRLGSEHDCIYVIDVVSLGSFDEVKMAKLRSDYQVSSAILANP